MNKTDTYSVEVDQTDTGYRFEVIRNGSEMVDAGSRATREAAELAGEASANSYRNR